MPELSKKVTLLVIIVAIWAMTLVTLLVLRFSSPELLNKMSDNTVVAMATVLIGAPSALIAFVQWLREHHTRRLQNDRNKS